MKKLLSLLGAFLMCTSVFSADVTIQAETMTVGGPYAGLIDTPFNGIALYGNDDNGTATVMLPTMPGQYRVEVRGASNNSTTAGVSLQIDGVQVTTFAFTGTAATTEEREISLQGSDRNVTVTLILKTDDGTNDTFIDWIAFTYIGEAQPPATGPKIPDQGAFFTGKYRNMFKEAGYTQAQIDAKISSVYEQLFYGDDQEERVYYTTGVDEAYILDVASNDVRTEGMSYGMMIAVQMNKQEEFDRLWKFSKTHMQHKSGNREGYFSWMVSTTGQQLDPNPAPDGEIYFVTALYFASVRFGDRDGIFNYRAEADYILKQMLNKGWPHDQIPGSVTNMFSPNKQIVYVPYAMASTFSNPSYYLPSFYEVWAIMADENNAYWSEAADVARDYFQSAAHPVTGLMPDYANFDGTPTGGHKEDFVVDAWRCIMNVAMDYAWFKKDEREKELAMRIQSFFHVEGMYDYWSGYKIDGTPLEGTNYQSAGLVACNAVGSLASDSSIAWDFIHNFWNRQPTTGLYRYYDGMLHMMSLLHLAGEFRAYADGMVTSVRPSARPGASVDIYPNPSSGDFTIGLGELSSVKSITIMDMTGKVMYSSSSISNNTVQINGLEKGLYILNILDRHNSYSQKVIVK